MIVIEHHQAVMAHADWIIDLGPGAGSDGGRVVFEGPPRDLVDSADTLTAQHLRAYVGAYRPLRRGWVGGARACRWMVAAQGPPGPPAARGAT